jgi:hypothetical protein
MLSAASVVTDHPASRTCYQQGCRELRCKAANAAYQAARRSRQAHGQPLQGQKVPAKELWKLIDSLRIEHFSYAEIARRLGLPCLRVYFDTDRVTVKSLARVRALYRRINLEGPSL